MISVVIPTLNAEFLLAPTLSALVPAMVDGVVRQVIVSDGGSADRTIEIADAAGADIVKTEACRGSQLAAGASVARFPWLLFLHADTVLEEGWSQEALSFIERVDRGRVPEAAAAFRFALDGRSFRARLLETGVRMRCSLFRLPYGDQGLLIPRRLYDEVGGFQTMPIMEDVAMVDCLGRRRVVILKSRAITSAKRFEEEGYAGRSVRNLSCLFLYRVGVSTRYIDRVYRGRKSEG